MQPPRGRGAQRRRAHRRNWRDATSLCTMRGGAMRWNFRTAWSERKQGREWGVHEGKTEQSRSYKKADDAIEKNDAVQQFGAASPVLMVLASEKGWPYSWNTIQDPPKDVFVNCEVERVWQIVRGRSHRVVQQSSWGLLYAWATCVDWDARDREVDGCRLVPPLPAAALRCRENPSGSPLFWWRRCERV
ncbi:putative retrotransposon hot spot protein (RHS) [Trypanosoma cruzi]|uniref:Putative retrotransposon hot spot protein (RHS) n=1 Tax=Trypanosoma cruzi TaxID=5693 RepID=A0A2V2VXP5_TRYCR|nr:putative retrotransposon hot spot protein (RHS) [Trypanosoma cruzi]